MKTWHYVISELCNMNCTYCNVDVHNNTRLDIEHYKEFIKNISKEEEEDFIFHIFGGEAFLQLDMVEFIVNDLKDNFNCKEISITTNGTIFNQRIKKLFDVKKFKCTISYDGTEQVNNRGDHKLYIDELKEAGSVKAHMMLVGSNFKAGENFLVKNHILIESMGLIPDMTLVRDIDTFNDFQVGMFLTQYRGYCALIIDKINLDSYDTFNELPGLIKQYLSAILDYGIMKHSKENCSAGIDYHAIEPNGTVSPCERFSREVEGRDLLEEFNNLEDKTMMNECKTCSISDVCHKGCIYENIKNKGVILSLCAIYKGIVEELQMLVLRTNNKVIDLYLKG